MRRVADTDWEAEHYVVVSCGKLRADKKKYSNESWIG